MKRRLSRTWSIIRQALSIRSLLDLLGIKAIVIAILSSAGLSAWAWIYHLPRLLTGIFIGVGAVVVTLAAAKQIGQAWNTRRVNSCLDFVEWTSSGSRGVRRFGIGAPSIIEVTNTTVAIPRTARDIIASIQFSNAAGTQRLTIHRAPWLFVTTTGAARTTEWRSSLDLEGGETQCFVLFVRDDYGRLWAYDEQESPSGPLKDGQWQAFIQVTSADAKGFEGVLSFTISRDGRLQHDQPAFRMQRYLPPRLSSRIAAAS